MIVLAVLIVIILVWPLVEAKMLTTEKVQLKADQLPAEANNLRIVYLSDIHYGFWFSDADLSRLIGRINSLRPDLLLFGGDYATDNETAIKFFRTLQKQGTIHSRYGIYGVIGEADRGESDATCKQLTEAMTNAGVVPLVNKVAPVNIAGRQIFIAGLDDKLTGKPDIKGVAKSVNAGDYVILLCHNPSVIQEAQVAVDASGNLSWFDLGLFGHTHAGQMAFFSTALNIAEDVPDRYRSGWLKENRVDLLISPGIGTSVFPGRLFCFPTIHCITITY